MRGVVNYNTTQRANSKQKNGECPKSVIFSDCN